VRGKGGTLPKGPKSEEIRRKAKRGKILRGSPARNGDNGIRLRLNGSLTLVAVSGFGSLSESTANAPLNYLRSPSCVPAKFH